MRMRSGLYFDPAAPAADPASPSTPTTTTSPVTENPNGGQGAQEQTVPLARFNEVNRRLRDLERANDQAENERKQREEADAAKRGEFEQLANQRGEQVKQLEPFKVKAERFEKALTTHLETQRAGLPPHIIALLDRLDAVDQLEWIATNREALGAATTPADKAPPKPGNPPSPKPAGGNPDADAVARSKDALQKTGNYAGTF